MRLHPDEIIDMRRTQHRKADGPMWIVAFIGIMVGVLCVCIVVYGKRMLAEDTAPIGCEQHRAELVACVEGL